MARSRFATGQELYKRGRFAEAIGTAVVGGVFLITGAAPGGTALAQRASYDRTCDGGHCDQPQYYLAHNEAIVTDMLISVGAAAAVTSIVLFATRPKAHPVSLAPQVGRGAAALTPSGAF